MKRLSLILLATAFLGSSFSAVGAGVGDLKTVYLLPMSNRLDQYLAIALTQDAVMQVVTDPAKADAVLTDHLGADFEEKMNSLYGAKKGADDKAEQTQTFARVGTGGHAKGAAFLVNRKTGEVVWSSYMALKNSSPKALKRATSRLSQELGKALNSK